MRETIRLVLGDEIGDAESNELTYDEYGVVGFDPDFKPAQCPLEFKLNTDRPTYIVELRSNDNGNIPHFHIFDADNKFKTCVRIDEAEYFHHGAYTGILNRKSRYALNKLLQRQIDFNGETMTNWDRIVKAWNSNSDRLSTVTTVACPDYTQLPDA